MNKLFCSCEVGTLDTARLRELLAPFVGQSELSSLQLSHISTYINILTKWNERTNLTSIRDPEEMIRRHFGESLFAAAQLLNPADRYSVVDVGSGAGFPGLPIKVFAPDVQLSLIEAHAKKNTFLREAVRAMNLTGVEVFLGRAEQFASQGDLVTMRAVEKFESVLLTAANLVADQGRLALLIGVGQRARAQELVEADWEPSISIPQSDNRVLLVGRVSKHFVPRGTSL